MDLILIQLFLLERPLAFALMFYSTLIWGKFLFLMVFWTVAYKSLLRLQSSYSTPVGSIKIFLIFMIFQMTIPTQLLFPMFNDVRLRILVSLEWGPIGMHLFINTNIPAWACFTLCGVLSTLSLAKKIPLTPLLLQVLNVYWRNIGLSSVDHLLGFLFFLPFGENCSGSLSFGIYKPIRIPL